MKHEGEKIRQLSHEKGFKQVDLAAMRGVTRQTISGEFKLKRLGVDTLKWYSQVLDVPIEEITKASESQVLSNDVNYKEKYFELLEETKKLWQVVSQNGIKVDLGKFNVSGLHGVNFFCSY